MAVVAMITKWLRKKLKFCVALSFSFLHGTISTNHHSGFARLANFYSNGGTFFFAIVI
jgi:hypothetical protein